MKTIGILFGIVLVLLAGMTFWSSTPYRYITEGTSNLNTGKVALAIEVLNDGLNHYPENSELAFLLAKACLSSGEYEDANKVVKDKQLYISLKENKEFQDFLIDLAEENQRSGDSPNAVFFAKKYMSIEPKETTKRIVKNHIKASQILSEDAIDILQSAFNLAAALKDHELKESVKGFILPKYLQQIKDLRSQKKNDEALDILDKAEVLGKTGEIFYQEALIYKELERYDDAWKKFDESLQVDPQNEEYRLSYAETLEQAAGKTEDKEKKKEFIEKAKLFIGDATNDERKSSLLSKIINLNAKFKVRDGAIKVSRVGDFLYPSITFTIEQISDIEINGYRVIFFEGNSQIDIYQSSVTPEELNQPIEVICSNPVSEDKDVSARLYLNKEFISEFKMTSKKEKKIKVEEN